MRGKKEGGRKNMDSRSYEYVEHKFCLKGERRGVHRPSPLGAGRQECRPEERREDKL